MVDHSKFLEWLIQWNNPFLWFVVMVFYKFCLETLPWVAPRWRVYWSSDNEAEMAKLPNKTRITLHFLAGILIVGGIFVTVLGYQFITSVFGKVK